MMAGPVACTMCRMPMQTPRITPPLAAGESIQPAKGSSMQATMIEGRKIVTGRLPLFFLSARSANAFVNV